MRVDNFGENYTYQVPYRHFDKVAIRHNGEILEIQLIALRINTDEKGQLICVYIDSLNRRWKDSYLIENDLKNNIFSDMV